MDDRPGQLQQLVELDGECNFGVFMDALVEAINVQDQNGRGVEDEGLAYSGLLR